MAIVDEIREYFHSSECSSDILEFYPIGKEHLENRLKIKNWILQAMNRNPSHSITGVYSMGNMVSKPYKYYALIGSFNDGGILMNVDPGRSWLIVIDYMAKNIHFEELERLLSNLTSVLVFASGQNIINLADTLYKQNKFFNKLANNVYTLQVFNSATIDNCNPNANIIRHPTTEANFKLVKEFYEYSDENMDDLPNTHVVLELDDELVAGARSNEEIDDFVVIGGVKTVIDKRHQKLGFTVCYHLVNTLQEKFTNIFLETDIDNFPAIRIYEKLGFHQIGVSAFYEKGIDMISKIIGDRDY